MERGEGHTLGLSSSSSAAALLAAAGLGGAAAALSAFFASFSRAFSRRLSSLREDIDEDGAGEKRRVTGARLGNHLPRDGVLVQRSLF